MTVEVEKLTNIKLNIISKVIFLNCNWTASEIYMISKFNASSYNLLQVRFTWHQNLIHQVTTYYKWDLHGY